MGIFMNKLTQKSFWQFLSLYLVSSTILLFTSSYWFYSAQTTMQKSYDYYKLKHIADEVSTEVIKAHMMGKPLELKIYDKASVGLYDKNHTLVYGSSQQDIDFSKDYYMKDKIFTVISTGVSGHLGVSYVVVQSTSCASSLKNIKEEIFLATILIFMFILIVSVVLGKIFLRPIKEKMQEIENFVKDTTHELNTPISALMMSTSRAKTKQTYDAKIIQNISISTKQLHDIYASLSYISFDSKEEDVKLRFDLVVKESIEYFNELLEKKNISLDFQHEHCVLNIAPTKAKMLISNLLSNAIKYSHPNSKIYVEVSQEKLSVKDEGIGIAKDKLSSILNRFTRANDYAGGFGVGLSIIDEITKKYSYKLTIASVLDEGTEVIVYLKSRFFSK